MMSAIFESVEDVTNKITVQSTLYPNQKLKALVQELTWRAMTSIPLWIMNERLRSVEPGA